MRRRDFVRLLGGAAVAGPLPAVAGEEANARQPAAVVSSQEAIIEALRQELAQSHAGRQQLLTIVHEMRTPTAAVVGYCELIADRHDAGLPADVRVALDRIDLNGRRLAAMINDVFAGARSTAIS